MVELYRDAMIGQYEGALFTLKQCADLCSDDLWEKPVSLHSFSECVFHPLFFGDLYLGKNVAALREQSFHQEHPEIFRDYEEMEDRVPQLLYSKEMIDTYFNFVRQKVHDVVIAETADSLAEPVGFEWLDFARAEMHPYNIRHIQHHAAQLILKLRLETDENPRWFRSRQTMSGGE